VLKIANHADGTATGTVINLDGSAIEIPIAIVQKEGTVTISVPMVTASWLGTLNAAGSELTGTWRQGGTDLPLTFRRGEPK
jgi:hypothetical protein